MKNWVLSFACVAALVGLSFAPKTAQAQVDPNDPNAVDMGGGVFIDPNGGGGIFIDPNGGVVAPGGGGRGGRGGRGGGGATGAGGAGGVGGGGAAGGGGRGGGGAAGGATGGFQGGATAAGGGGGGGRGGGGRPQTLQQALNSPDDEWAVLAPRIQKVLDLMGQYNGAAPRTATAGGAGGRGGAQPVMAQNVGTNTAQMQNTYSELYAILNASGASDDQVKGRLEAYRQAKALVKDQMLRAQEELRNYLTLRQEAIMTGLGYLDTADRPSWLSW